MNGFLAADRRLQFERLSLQLTLDSAAAQGSTESIRRLRAELDREADREG